MSVTRERVGEVDHGRRGRAPGAAAAVERRIGSRSRRIRRGPSFRRRRHRVGSITRRRGTSPDGAWRRTTGPSARAMTSNTGCVSVIEPLMTLQHLGGGRLALERLPGLVEQARVLDRDHRLVGEGLRQGDSWRRKRRLARAARSAAERLAVTQHRHGQSRCGSRARSDVGRAEPLRTSTMSVTATRRAQHARPAPLSRSSGHRLEEADASIGDGASFTRGDVSCDHSPSGIARSPRRRTVAGSSTMTSNTGCDVGDRAG